jgi:NAD(P)H-hydrate epimerase
MKPYLTRTQLKEIDRISTDKYGIPSLILMENAGRAVAEETIKLLKHKKNPRITVICGKGNNGGDGFVTARHLYNQHCRVIIFYLGHLNVHKSRSEAHLNSLVEQASDINLNIIRKLKIRMIELPWLLDKDTQQDKTKWNTALRLLKTADIIIDAIVGIGLEREIQSPLREFIARINSLNIPVVAVDIPSGLDTDTGQPLGIAIKAKRTVTFGFPKIGFLKPSSRKYLGKLTVADISIPCNIS